MSSEGAPGPPMRGSDVPVQNDKITQLQAELAEAKRKIEAVEASIQTAQSKVDRKGASEKVQESLYKAIAADKQTRATLEAKAFKLEGKIDDALNQAASGGKPPQQDASEPTLRDPFPGFLGHSSEATPHHPPAHEHAPVEPTEAPFGLLDDTSFETIADKPNTMWDFASPMDRGNIRCGSEHDVAGAIKLLLLCIVKNLGLAMDVILEKAIFGVRPDMWVLVSHGVPVGAVEVKNPDTRNRGTMNNATVLGELYDCMLQLNNFYNTPIAFGILTTGIEYRICWFKANGQVPDSMEDEVTFSRDHDPPTTPQRPSEAPVESSGAGGDVPAQRRSPPGVTPSKRTPIDHTLQPEEDAETQLSHEDDRVENERRMFVSDIVSAETDSAGVVKLVAAALVRMSQVPPRPFEHPFQDIQTRALLRFELGEHTSPVVWSRKLSTSLLPDHPCGQMNKVARPRAIAGRRTFLWAVEDLGTGVSGRVWLTSSASGAICVLKFGKGEDPQKVLDKLKHERDMWMAAYHGIECLTSNVAVETWSGHVALRMPHCSPVPVAERKSCLVAVKYTLQTFFEARGLVHRDVKWRNLGRFRPIGSREPMVVVFDLDSVSKRTEEDSASWISEAVHKLEQAVC